MPLVRQRVATGMPEHVRMRFETKPRLSACALDHAREAGGAERRASLRGKHKGRLGLLFALKPRQGAEFVPEDWMGARRASLDPADVQCPQGKLDLIPAEVNEFGGTKAVSVRQQNHRDVPMPPAVLPGRIHEALNLSFS